MSQVIGLKPKTLLRSERYGFLGRKTRNFEVTACTWTIDGTAIAEWVRRHRQADDPAIPIEETIWVAGDAEDARDRVARLLGQAPPEFGTRTGLLMCPVCGDFACGALTAEIIFDEDLVAWKAIGYDGSGADEQPYQFKPPLILQFDRDQYVNTLTSALEALSSPVP